MEKFKKYADNKYIHIPIYIIFVVLTAFIVSSIYFDNDGYFIIASGNYILKHGIPKINPFSCVKNLQIVIQQWPWAIYCAFMYQKFGKMALFLSCMGLYLLNVFAFRAFAKINGINLPLATITTMFVLAMSFQFLTIRPTLITTFLLVLQMCVLEKYKQTEKTSVLIWLVLISIAEINMHSAIWFLHFVFMLPYIVPPIRNPFVNFKYEPYNRKPLILTMIPMAFVGLLNPYGLEGIKYIFYSFGKELKNANISEMECFKLSSFFGLFIILSIFLILHSILKRKDRKISSDMFYLFCGCSIMGFMYIRNLVYFLFGLTFILFELLSFVDMEKVHVFISKQKQSTCMLTWVVVIVALFVAGSNIVKNVNMKVENTSLTPTNAITYLEANHVPKDTNIYTAFNNGGFFEFNGYKCFIDARPELYFKKLNKQKDVFQDYMKLELNTDISYYEDFLDEYDFEYLCVQKCTMFDTYMQTNDNYEIVVNSKEYNLYRAK